jgi:D-arabinose 1-dehydrogenase-like Zn-dependent alcohol dehydrogenase
MQYAQGALAAGTKLDLIKFTPPALGANEVHVDVKYCGMCHS